MPPMISRRSFLKQAIATSTMALPGSLGGSIRRAPAAERAGKQPWFLTRGVVLVVKDLRTLDWPQRAKRAGLTTLATHICPHEVAEYVKSPRGQEFLVSCRKLGLQVEHELHAMSDLLPRGLFEKDPSMYRVNEKGQRSPDCNCCIHSPQAVGVICENVVKYAGLLRPTTEVTGPLGYVRFHGRNAANWWTGDNASRYDYLYSPEELAEWVDRIRAILEKVPVLLLFFNNHWRGNAAKNAREMRMLLQAQGLV